MIIPSDGLIGRVSFTRNKEIRPQLFETRTPEEIVVYAKENNLLHLLSLALYNNDVGFGHFPAFAKIRKGNDGYVVNLMDSKAGDIVIDADSDTMEGILLARIRNIPPADVRPVVTCAECEWHVDCGYHFCNKWCQPCPDNADFYCAYGERQNCGAKMEGNE